MKRRILATLLCICMLVGMSIPVHAATPNFSAELSESTLYVSEQPQTVTMKISASEAIAACCIDFRSTVPTGWSASAALTSEASAGITGTYNDQTGKFTSDAESNVEDLTDLAVITYTIPANTQAGTYTVGVTELYVAKLEENGVDTSIWADDISVSATLTIKDAPAATGYTAALSTSSSNNEVVSEGNITVNVGVSHSSDTVFNAGEIKLSYDGTKLTPVTDGIAGTWNIENEGTANAVLTIEDFGGDKSFANDNYAIKFNAASVDTDTTTEVKLTSAAFVHKANANTSDLIAATNVPLSLNVTIKVAMVQVTLTNSTDSTSASTTTPKDQDYIFAPDDTANYEYTDVTATVDGQEIKLTDNGDGTFTLGAEYVTGDFTVTYERNPKSYNVGWTGDGAGDVTNKPTSATYGTPLTISIPADFEATQDQAGARYTATVSIGSEVVQNLSGGESYTIEGSAITDIITINVDKEVIPSLGSDDITITVTGDAGVTIQGADGNSITIDPDTDVTLILTEEPGYSYSVVDDSGNSVTFTDDGEYTFTATESVTFTVTKTLDVTSVTVAEYVKVDNYIVWLVTFKTTLENGKVPTYDGKTMFWSDKYSAYCYLVIADTLTADGENGAKTKVSATTGTATNVTYDKDINGTGTTDAADAQVVWNMYNALYAAFNTGAQDDTNPTMAQFLAADQNAVSTDSSTWKLTVEDAQVIIDAILAGTTN